MQFQSGDINSTDFVSQFRTKVENVFKESKLGENKHLFTIQNNYFNFYKVLYNRPGIENFEKDFIFSEISDAHKDRYSVIKISSSLENDLNFPETSTLENILNFFIANEYIQGCSLEKVLPASISYFVNPKEYAFEWIKSEYKNINLKLSNKQFELSKFNTNLLNRSKFEFEEIIEQVNDEQFTNYLEQCIGAYNKGWFYTAACSIGPLIETLLYKMATNYEDKPFKSATLTHGNYAEKLRHFNKKTKNYPENQRIHFDHFEEVSLERNYLTRNAVSHYSTGFANEELVNNLFMALKDVYDRYYLPSYNFKQAHPELN
ncbi:hypothetical protein [Pediococcus pentosaceus]|uniref:hypothetical protein n=1 Tax=Pediococcus pentosaceus TaxID=1255 RepID=UPI002FBEBE38